jgi:hypothetical protein
VQLFLLGLKDIDRNQLDLLLPIIAMPMCRVLGSRRSVACLELLLGAVAKYDRVDPLKKVHDRGPVLVVVYRYMPPWLYGQQS